MHRKLLRQAGSHLTEALLLGLLLAGCVPSLPLSLPTPVPTTPPVILVPPSPLPPTDTPLPPATPTETSTPIPTATDTPTPTETPSPTQTEPPTGTPVSWKYIFPIQPPGVASFAEGVVTHGYPATDLFAPEGAKFVAVTDGVVDYVTYADQWEPVMDDPALRGGLSVAIIGDDGVRYYGSHLSAIASGIRPGVRVTAGQLLGLVGHSGDAINGDFHLHFGISAPTYPEDWRARRGQVDPFPFLVAWRAGNNVTPPLEATPVPASPFTYFFPVEPGIFANFSAGGHGYPATDIFAPAGSHFVAVTSGVVDAVSTVDLWDPLTNPTAVGGLWVSLLGDDGIRYYGAHLSAINTGIKVGTRVRAGDLLGLVGNSGDARNTETHLHFEISHPLSASDWMSRASLLDPFPFLQAWKDSQNVTPH